LANAEAELAAAREEIKRQGDQIQQLTANLDSERKKAADLAKSLEDISAEHSKELADLEASREKDLEALGEKHRKELDDLLAAQIEETQEMQRQFLSAQELLQKQVQLLQEQYAELQALYSNRPSREEDLDRIGALEREIAEKTQQLQTMAETLQKFKLELVNREQNYNKVFGSSPNVGVMDPTARKGSRQSLDRSKTEGRHSNAGLPSLSGARR